ncbi:hypothetical protein ABPG77_010147 [Micractinium sp. CCAP 211/92]
MAAAARLPRTAVRSAVHVLAARGRRGSSGGSSSGGGAGEPPRPTYRSEMERLARERVLAMDESQLRSRLRRMRNLENLERFNTVRAQTRLTWPDLVERDAMADAARPRKPRRSGADASALPAAAPLGAGDALRRLERKRPEVSAAMQAELRAKREQRLRQKQVADKLTALGMEVYLPRGDGKGFDWDMLAGYDEVKRQVEETVILALSHPEVYDEIAAATRSRDAKPGVNRPRAVLFEGPPGTGKTTCARVIAEQGAVPLVNVRLEHILSKWYGEDEKKLAEVLTECEKLGTAVVFLDELDSSMSTREDHLHETTKRMLGILLRHLEGLDSDGERRTVFIGATNRKADLDPALRSRFATTIFFGLPDAESRAAILRRYARHLADSEVSYLAKETAGMAGRDLRAVCELTERRWAAEVIKGRMPRGQLPTVLTYLKSVEQRRQETGKGRGGPDGGDSGTHRGIRLR